MKVPMRSPFPFLSGRISISSLSSAALFACAILLGVGARRAWADAAPAAGEQVPRVFTYRGQLTLDSGSSAGASPPPSGGVRPSSWRVRLAVWGRGGGGDPLPPPQG